MRIDGKPERKRKDEKKESEKTESEFRPDAVQEKKRNRNTKAQKTNDRLNEQKNIQFITNTNTLRHTDTHQLRIKSIICSK